MCKYIVELKDDELEFTTLEEVKTYAVDNLPGSYDGHMNFKQMQTEMEKNGMYLEVEN